MSRIYGVATMSVRTLRTAKHIARLKFKLVCLEKWGLSRRAIK